MKLIVCAFPGMGKSTAFRNTNFLSGYERMSRVEHGTLPKTDSILYDTETNNFPKENFLENYLDYIVSSHSRAKNVVQMVSAHRDVTDGLVERGLQHFIVYPRAKDKDIFLGRYRDRGSPEEYIECMGHRWDDIMTSLHEAVNHPMSIGIEVESNMYIDQVISSLIKNG